MSRIRSRLTHQLFGRISTKKATSDKLRLMVHAVGFFEFAGERVLFGGY
jgi:hypothetical protein